MFYPDEIVEEVRARNDIVDVISSYVRLNKKGSNYFGLCPFHNEKTGSFSVTPSKQMFYCFGCHEGGNVITFVEKYENYTFPEALKVLADRAGVTLPDNMSENDKRKESKRSRLLEINKEAGKFYYYQLRSDSGKRAYDYLTGRGLSEETIKRFGLGYARSSTNETYRYLKQKGFSDELLRDSGLFIYREQSGMTDKFWNRVIFPIMDVSHRIIGFGGRVMGDGEPKYLNSPETEIFDKSRNLFGLNIAKSSKAKSFIICEGYMDAISLHQAGFDQAVASLGTAFTSGHANLILRYARYNQKSSEVTRYRDILLCYDSDLAGVDAAKRAISTLREVGLMAKVVNMRPYKDPDEFIKALGAEEFQKRLDEAENGFMFEIRLLEADYDLKDPTGKSKFLSDVAYRILQFEDAIERDSYVARVADCYNVSSESLNELVKKQAAKGITTKPSVVKSSHNVKADPIEIARKPEGTLLNWISSMPEIYSIVREYISPNDFSDGLYRQVATILFEQMDEGKPEPANIITMFTEEDEQKQVVALFHEGEEFIEDLSDKEATLKDLIIRIKEQAIENADDSDTQVDSLANMIEQTKKLEELRNIRIDLSRIGS